MKLEISRHISFEDLPGRTAWLGASPTDKLVRAEFGRTDGKGLKFFVTNGAWGGTLYQESEEGCLYIIDERGTRHEPVYIVELVEQAPALDECFGEGIPF